MALRNSNPAFNRMAGFNGRNAQGNATYAGNGQSYAGYGDPSTWGTGAGTPAPPGAPVTHTPTGTDGPMTIDSTVQKTGITLGVLLVAAAATWLLTGDPTVTPAAATTLYALAGIGALGGFVLSLVNSFKRVVSPALVIGYAALEGVFIGAMSKAFQTLFGQGVVTGAVVGTVAAFAGTLAAYKFFNIKVGPKFHKMVFAGVIGMVALSLLDVVLSLFGAAIGFNGFGPLGLLFSVAGLVLAVFMLISDFDYVERGVAAGLPERESWRAAFGLTVTIVWIYVNLLRILAILRGN